MFKLGKKQARPWPFGNRLQIDSYLYAAELPAVPKVFGSPQLIQSWKILANDFYGDCVWAGAAHETMMLRAAAHYQPPLFSNTAVLSDYSAVTGFKQSDPSTDQGTDVQEAAAYRQKTGILDASGQRHKIDSYAALKPGDLHQLDIACYLFGAVGIGVDLPDTAEDQFNRMEPWSVVSGSSSMGGHYVPIVGRNSLGMYLAVTWGRLQAVEPGFIMQFMDEGLVYVSTERLNQKGFSPQGVDLAGLQSDFAAVTT